MADQQVGHLDQLGRRDRTSFKNRESVAFLKRFDRESAARSSIITQPRQSPVLPVQAANASESRNEAEDDWRPQSVDDEEEDPLYAAEAKRAKVAKAALEAEKFMAISNAHEKEKNKENLDQRKETVSEKPKSRAFIDRQESAERVTWEESPPSNRQRSDSQKRMMRARPTVEDEESMSDPSEDESFQQDNRPSGDLERRRMAPTAQRRTTAPAKASSSRPTRPPRLLPPPDDEDDDVQRQIRQDVERHSRSSPAQSQPPTRSQAQIADQQKRINKLAKDQVRARAPAKVQTRRPWSPEETSMLIEYIMEHGTSYAFIKKLDEGGQNILEGRDQIALKDKARNIKTDYLKARKELPPNFDKIPLNKGLKDKLGAIGVIYDDQTGLADYEDE